MIYRGQQVETKVLGDRLYPKKKVKIPKEHPEFPWVQSDGDESRHIGNRGDRSSEDVMAFLGSVGPALQKSA